MKPPMQEELEDDLAAEEENKLINEVIIRFFAQSGCLLTLLYCLGV